jgi:electron transport complex protein RnfE
LLAVTTTVVNGLTLGIATAAVLLATNTLVSLLRKSLVAVARIPLFVLIIAALVTSVDLLTNALLFELHEILGLFIPLIITNCAILAQAETVASRQPVGRAALAGLSAGLGFLAVLVVLGALREAIGAGTLFAGMHLLLGDIAAGWTIDLPFDGVLAAALPPGAFFGLAALVALRNWGRERRERARDGAASPVGDASA